jgi:hypothetical protein
MVQVSAQKAFNNPPPPSWKKRIAKYTGCILFALATFHIWKEQPVVTTHNASHTIQTKIAAPASSANPAVHKESINGIQVLWTVPVTTKPPCGILLVCHGCSHSGTDFFRCDDDDEGCLGLPEELAIVQIALDLNLVVVAISSQNRQRKCWSTEQDGPRAVNVLTEFVTRFSVDKKQQIPIYAFGASSGGSFVSQLGSVMMANGLVLDGFLSQIMAETSPVEVGCTVYITMNRDTRTDERAQDIVGNTTTNNKHAKKHIRLPSLPLSPTYFSDRIPIMTQEESSRIYTALLQNGYLDPNTKLLIQDPRQSQWRYLVWPLLTSSQDTLQADRSPISEVLNVAYGQHEMAREGVKAGLEFCVASLPQARRRSC